MAADDDGEAISAHGEPPVLQAVSVSRVVLRCSTSLSGWTERGPGLMCSRHDYIIDDLRQYHSYFLYSFIHSFFHSFMHFFNSNK